MLVVPFVIINFGINLNLQMPNIFQQSEKLYSRLFAGLTMAGSGSFHCPTAPRASARCAGRTI